MSDLALAAFAAETGGHVVSEPRERRFARFRGSFDEQGYRSSLAARQLRFVGRRDPALGVRGLRLAAHQYNRSIATKGNAATQRPISSPANEPSINASSATSAIRVPPDA